MTNLATLYLRKKIESVQCDAVLAITGGIKSFSWGKLWQELGLAYLYKRTWARPFCLPCKAFLQNY